MAKRSRKARKAARPQRYSKRRAPSQQKPAGAPAASATAAQAAPPKAAATTSTATVDFAKEYHYVIQDLRRLFTLAIALMILLVVLAYFLT